MRHLLIVEDDSFLRNIANTYLIHAGYEVKLAINLKEARELFESYTFDLIILDLSLPDGDGFDWALEITRTISCPPIIYMTSHTDVADVKKGFEIGGADYMKKPIELEELALRVKHSLSDYNTGAGHIRKIGDYRYNPTSLVLTYKDQSTLLGQLQGSVLDELSICIGRVVTKDDLLTKYWGEANYFTSRNLDSVIVKLRAQFKKDSRIYFAALKKVGYRLLVYDQPLS